MLSLFDRMMQKRLLRRYLIFLGAVIAFHSVVYYPLYLFLASNVIWKNSIFFFLLTEIAEPLSVYLFFWGSFSFLIYAAIRFGGRAATPYLIVYAAGSVLRYALQNVCFMIMMGVGSWLRHVNAGEILLNLLFDFLIMGAVYALLHLFLSHVRKRGETLPDACLPPDGFFAVKNALVKLLMAAAVIPSLARIITRVYYDIRMIVFEEILISGPTEILLMVTYYLTDVLTAFLGYLLMFVMISSFHLSDFKSKMKFEEK